MTARKIIKFAGISLALALVLAVLFLWLFDFSQLKPKIESAVSNAIGREFHINGNFELDVLPTPTVLIENASLASPAWSTDSQMLEVGKAYAEVKLLSLISKPIVVKNVELKDVKVLVETGPEEQLNWSFETETEKPEPEPEEGGSTQELPVTLEHADISNIQVVVRKPEAEDMIIKLDTLSVLRQPDATTKLDGKGQVAKLPIAVNAVVAKRHTDLQAQVGEVNITSQYDYPDDTVDVNLTVNTLGKVGDLLKIKDLPNEDLSLKGNLGMQGDVIVLQNIVAQLSSISVNLDGEFDTSDSSAIFKISAKGDKLSLLSPGLPSIAFDAQTDLKLEQTSVELSPFSVAFGKSKLNGKAHVDTGGHTAIRADVKSNLIDLSPFMEDDKAGAENKEAKKDSKEKPKAKYVFEDTPIPFDTLKNLDVSVNADIAKVMITTGEINDVKLKLEAKNGTLKTTNSFAGQHGGQFKNNIAIQTAGKSANLIVNTQVRDFRLTLLSGADVPADQIPLTNLGINLKGAGGSPRAIAASLNGAVVVTQGKGKVSNELINTFSGDIIAQLFSALNPFAKDEKFTNWECSLFAIKFASGEGKVDGFLMQSEKLMAVGSGEIDLNDESLDFEFNTKPRKGVGVSADMFVTPFVKLTGTLAEPSVGLNKKGLLLSGGAAVLTGGMSFLYTGLMDRATAESDRCDEAMKALKGSAATTGQATKGKQ